jgi:hypothetical protein
MKTLDWSVEILITIRLDFVIIYLNQCSERIITYIYLFGDSNQCDPVEGGPRISYKYTTSPAVAEMYDTVVLDYKSETGRYCEKTKRMLQWFLKKRKAPRNLAKTDESLMVNICYLNSTKRKVTSRCCKAFVDKHKRKPTVFEFQYMGKTETCPICRGMPVIATTNIKESNMFNTCEFRVKSIGDDDIILNTSVPLSS